MRLIRAHIRNFKLLEDIRLEFSTNRDRPLTVIRAENGSGKTSLLYAIQWAFYGLAGLPGSPRSLRLSSSALAAGTATTVSVMIEFAVQDDFGNSGRYRLVRSAIETPIQNDEVSRDQERVRLLKITPSGEEEVQSGDAEIQAWVPARLKEVFFTDGDSVQAFISGQIATRKRQDRVQGAIRDLLGIERFRSALGDIEWSHSKLRAEAAKAGGNDTSSLDQQLEKTNELITKLKRELDQLNERHANMTENSSDWDKELRNLQGIGDIDEINDRIDKVELDLAALERQRRNMATDMRTAIKSEAFSWRFLDERLQSGLNVLDDLADRRVIPGPSVEVLSDRLAIGECICGLSLADGSDLRTHVEELLKLQEQMPGQSQRLTALSHIARQSAANEMSSQSSDQGFQHVAARLIGEFAELNDGLRSKGLERKGLIEKRNSIDEERVRSLVSRLEDVTAKIALANQEIGAKEHELELEFERKEHLNSQLAKALSAVKLSRDLAMKRDVAQEMAELASRVLTVLQDDYVVRVSDRMREIFMQIVGAPESPEREDFGSSLFTGVHIDENFNIVIDAREGRTLDPDFELNGASKRALTLSFIWALMEVSGVTAPRIIDTPLGMVSGGVKHRMVEAISRPPENEMPDYQVILFLTRSELRDVEKLIDARAGAYSTLSCSHHYPADLLFDWRVDYPVARACGCDHRHSCQVCARKFDKRHGVKFREN